MAEVRRALEAEAAGLAAQRRSAADVKRLKQAVQALDRAVKSGGDGVEQDLQFHRAIADAAHNPFLIGTLDYLSQFMRGAIGVTRANEARRADFAAQVRGEHAAVVLAIEAADVAKARSAASRHMNNAIRRIESADPGFWRQEGARLAVPLVGSR
jgi:GntR family transcriptional repressor for pyruvate dehydrogenase complex